MRIAIRLLPLLFVAACAVAPKGAEVIAAGGEPVRIATPGGGALSVAQSKAVLAQLKASAPETNILDRHVAIEEAVSSAKLTLGNRTLLLQDGPAAYPAMFQAIQSAKRQILLESYIFEDDDVGRRFADEFLKKVKQGVAVAVIYDSVGSIGTPPEFFQRLRDGGVKVAEFNPVNPLNAKKGWELNERDHRKLLVVDDRVAFLGGINISGVYSSGSFKSSGSKAAKKDGTPTRPWRDTQVQIEGPVVADMQKAFVDSWMRAEKDPPPIRIEKAAGAAGKEAVRMIAGRPDDEVNAIYATLLSAIQNSETSVHLTMAYFVPDPTVFEALKDAAKRGVDVKIILPSFTDFWAVFHAGRSYYEDLLEAGVKIYERKERLLHAKTAVIDGVWSSIGSANLDWRSLVHNYELNAVVLGTEFASQMEAAFQRDIGFSQEITREGWSRRPIKDRFLETAARVWSYWL